MVLETTRNAKESRWIGSLDIEAPLESLLYHFGKANGVVIDPMEKRACRGENRLIVFAGQVGYPTDELKQIRAGIPMNNQKASLDP
jgi:hypothetical protein